MVGHERLPGSARWIAEALLVYRFVIIGVLAAIVHMSLAWLLIERGEVAPTTSNLIGFSTAFMFSFLGQYFWTFRSKRHWVSAVWRFAAISVTAFAVNNALLLIMLRRDWFVESNATVLAACVIPVITYLGNRIWALT